MNPRRTYRSLGLWAAFSTLCLLATASAGATQVGTVTGGANLAALTEQLCGSCHKTTLFLGTKKTRAEWKQVTDDMVAYGMQISDAEADVVIDYLAGVSQTTADEGAPTASDARPTSGPGSGGSPPLTGVWSLVSYERDGEVDASTGYMMLSAAHFSRVCAARERSVFAGEPGRANTRRAGGRSPVEYVGEAGVYRVEHERRYFRSLAASLAETPNQEKVFRLGWSSNDLILIEDTDAGPAGTEVWRRVEEF